ncbi:MAG: putative ABC transporter permease [Ruminococcus sp.]|nr:putative ABC transporter permease [Ruminococcus sp.]
MKKDLSRIFFRYVFEFTAAGFAGWIYEVATVWIMFRRFENRGMLHLPVIPIYSVGAFILLALLRRKRNPLFIFLFAAVVTTVFELGASYLLEAVFHEQFWTYEGWYFSILDRSSLISSTIFGIMAVGYFYMLHPLSEKLSRKLPEGVCFGTGIFLSAAILTDIAISFSQHLKK